MTTNTPAAVVLSVGTAATSSFLAPLLQIFDGLALALFVCGAMGGLGFVLAQGGAPVRSVARRMLLGGLLAAGFSILAPTLLEKLLGLEMAPDGGGIRFLAASAFGVGFLQDALIEFFKRGKDHAED